MVQLSVGFKILDPMIDILIIKGATFECVCDILPSYTSASLRLMRSFELVHVTWPADPNNGRPGRSLNLREDNGMKTVRRMNLGLSAARVCSMWSPDLGYIKYRHPSSAQHCKLWPPPLLPAHASLVCVTSNTNHWPTECVQPSPGLGMHFATQGNKDLPLIKACPEAVCAVHRIDRNLGTSLNLPES